MTEPVILPRADLLRETVLATLAGHRACRSDREVGAALECVQAAIQAERRRCVAIVREWYERGLTCEMPWDDALYPDVDKIAAALEVEPS